MKYLILFFSMMSYSFASDDIYCTSTFDYDDCPTGSVIVVSGASDIARHCDFNQRMVNAGVSGLTNYQKSKLENTIVCVKRATPREEKGSW